VGVVGGGGGVVPPPHPQNPQNPKPQSPIPNPQFYFDKFKYFKINRIN